MASRSPVTLKQAVDAYIAVGHACGFAHAEALLMQHLPRSNPGGKVCDVARNRRRAFVEACRRAVAEAREPANG